MQERLLSTKLNLLVTRQHIAYVFRHSVYTKYKKPKAKPHLTKTYKGNRLKYSKETTDFKVESKKIIFQMTKSLI